MNRHRQLTQEQRYHISALLAAGNFQNKIADLAGVHKDGRGPEWLTWQG